MYIYIYVYTYIHESLHIYVYMYVIWLCMCVYTYIYIYIHTHNNDLDHPWRTGMLNSGLCLEVALPFQLPRQRSTALLSSGETTPSSALPINVSPLTASDFHPPSPLPFLPSHPLVLLRQVEGLATCARGSRLGQGRENATQRRLGRDSGRMGVRGMTRHEVRRRCPMSANVCKATHASCPGLRDLGAQQWLSMHPLRAQEKVQPR